jgi:hypothetical protein
MTPARALKKQRATAARRPPRTIMTSRSTQVGFACLFAVFPGVVSPQDHGTAPVIELWHGDLRRVGHLGDLQDDFNITGHVEPWRELDLLQYRINGGHPIPLAFRKFRRLARDGDFNADVPIGLLSSGKNTITLEAQCRDGRRARKEVTVIRESGSSPLPLDLRWRKVRHVDEAGQAVDGEWLLTPEGLRTARPGYDRIFLIGERSWRDYEVRTTVTVHSVEKETTPYSGGSGVGLILRFAGHVTGGPRSFPSGQPKWGYQPFGAIAWIRWSKQDTSRAPVLQFYRGDSDQTVDYGSFPVEAGVSLGMRFACRTLPEKQEGVGVTEYRFRIWRLPSQEPDSWTWSYVQTSRDALRQGGLALLAHHADVTFGDLCVRPLALAQDEDP